MAAAKLVYEEAVRLDLGLDVDLGCIENGPAGNPPARHAWAPVPGAPPIDPCLTYRVPPRIWRDLGLLRRVCGECPSLH